MTTSAAVKLETPAEKLARLETENASLTAKLAQANKPRAMTIKVGAKGGISVYGLGRFPVTLYVEQWQRLIGAVSEIESFIVDHSSELKTK